MMCSAGISLLCCVHCPLDWQCLKQRLAVCRAVSHQCRSHADARGAAHILAVPSARMHRAAEAQRVPNPQQEGKPVAVVPGIQGAASTCPKVVQRTSSTWCLASVITGCCRLPQVVVIGDSNTVGLPLAVLFRDNGAAAVTICHRMAYDSYEESRRDAEASERANADACLPPISGRHRSVADSSQACST